MRKQSNMFGRTTLAGAVLAAAAFVVACSDGTTAPSLKTTVDRDIIDLAPDNSLEGRVVICKETVGGTGSEVFTFDVSLNGGAATAVDVAAGACEDAVSGVTTQSTVVIVERAVANWTVSNIDVERSRRLGATDSEDEATRTATVFISNDAGRIVTYTNTFSPPPPPPGDEGCTPGYWKNHLGSWEGYAPNDLVSSVFTGASPFASNTLLEALNFGGGPGLDGAKKILLRAAVAALLNAAHSDVDYTMTTTEVIDAVNAALASGSRETILDVAGDLDTDNNLGCPLN